MTTKKERKRKRKRKNERPDHVRKNDVPKARASRMYFACRKHGILHITYMCFASGLHTIHFTYSAIALAKEKASNAKDAKKKKKTTKRKRGGGFVSNRKKAKANGSSSSKEPKKDESSPTKEAKKDESSSTKVKAQNLTARAVMQDPHRYLTIFISYWCKDENSPCVEGETIPLKSLQLWRKGRKKKVAQLAEHRFLPGISRTNGNKSFDFCISMNLIPVTFDSPDDPEETIDMVKPFTCAFWCCYCNLMADEPAIESDDCQLVSSNVNRMQNTCDSQLIHMCNTCILHVTHMQYAYDRFSGIC